MQDMPSFVFPIVDFYDVDHNLLPLHKKYADVCLRYVGFRQRMLSFNKRIMNNNYIGQQPPYVSIDPVDVYLAQDFEYEPYDIDDYLSTGATNPKLIVHKQVKTVPLQPTRNIILFDENNLDYMGRIPDLDPDSNMYVESTVMADYLRNQTSGIISPEHWQTYLLLQEKYLISSRNLAYHYVGSYPIAEQNRLQRDIMNVPAIVNRTRLLN